MSTSSASDQLDCVVDHGANEQRKSASSVRLVPRQRFENNGPVEVNLSILTARFHMRLPDAAKSLRISETSLKHVCRQLGVARWPRRMMLRAPPEEDCAGAGASTAGSRKGRDAADSEDESPQGSESRKHLAEEGAEHGAQQRASNKRQLLQLQRPRKSAQLYAPFPTTVSQYEKFPSQEHLAHAHTHQQQRRQRTTELERYQNESTSSEQSGAGGSQSPARESQSPPPQGSGSVTSDSDSTCLPNEWDFDRVLHHIGRGGPFQLTVEQYARDATACLDMQPYQQA